MESINNLSLLAGILREDTISSFQKTNMERETISKSPEGFDVLCDVELIEVFYLGLLSQIEKGIIIPKEYFLKAESYSIFKNPLIQEWIQNERKQYPIYYEHLLKIEICRSFYLATC